MINPSNKQRDHSENIDKRGFPQILPGSNIPNSGSIAGIHNKKHVGAKTNGDEYGFANQTNLPHD